MTANFKAWIKGSCHLPLITWFQNCVHSLCPSSESFPAFFSCDIYSIKPFLWCLTDCLQVIPGCIPLGFLWQALYTVDRFMQLRCGFNVLRDTDWFYAGCIPFRCVFSHFCHYTPTVNPFLRYPPSLYLCPLFVVTTLLFLSSGNFFLVFFLSSSPNFSSIGSHVLTSLAIYSPLLPTLFSFPRGLVQMSDQTKQHDPQRRAEFPLVHQSRSNVPVCCV